MAAAYAASQVHARGASLARLLDLTQPQPDWQLLDVATGAGHTALTFAPHVAWVTAVDRTPQMLAQTQQSAQARGLDNVRVAQADAGALPFGNGRFHLITCRLAAHHFPSIPQFVRAAARALRPEGLLVITDTIVPGSRLRGKKADVQRRAGAYVNALETLRDPSHGRNLSRHEWEDAFVDAGLRLATMETHDLPLDFDAYAARMRVSLANTIRLRAMLLQAPTAVAEFLTPRRTGDRIEFRFHEAILVGVKESNSTT